MLAEKTIDKTFNKTELLFNHIDNRIQGYITIGKSIDEIISTMESTYETFQQKVLNNSKLDSRFRYVYTHNIVIKKRIQDFYFIKTLQFNYKRYKNEPISKMFKLIQLRDKLDCNKLSVEIPSDFVIS